MFSVLVYQLYLINFVFYATAAVVHEGPSFHTTTVNGMPTTWTTTFGPSVSPSYLPSSATPTYPSISGTPAYPPTSESSTYPPTSESSTYPPTSEPPTYPPTGSSTYPPLPSTTDTYVSSSTYSTESSTLTYPPSSSSYTSSSSVSHLTNTSAYPTYTPTYPPAPAQGFANNTVNATDGRVSTYGDGWQLSNSSCGGTGKSCSQTGLYLNFTFIGTAVYMLTSLYEHSGTCSVALDNLEPVSIDGYVPTPNPTCVIAWSAYGLSNGPHTVVVTNLGQSQKATTAGQDNATIYESDGFIITTARNSTSAASGSVMANSLYLVGTLMTALLVSY